MRWQSWRGRIGAVLLLLFGIVLGSWYSMGRADSPELKLQVYAVEKGKGQLGVAVVVSQPETKAVSGVLEVALIDSNGKRIDTQSKQIRHTGNAATYGFTLERGAAALNDLRITAQFAGSRHSSPLTRALLAKGHETALLAGTEFFPGSSTAMQLEVRGVRNLAQTVPLPGSTVRVRIVREQDSREVFTGKTNADGTLLASFDIPQLPAGQYSLEIITESPLGQEKLTHQIRIRDDAKILLVSDKPIYQPGQTIHLRALALRPYNLRPVENTDILFEVEDSKGNKVFKRKLETSDYGVASIDFELADEVNMGPYQIRATLGNTTAEKTVTVKRYVLPKFKVQVKTQKAFYLPKEKIEGSIQADYFFGKPIARGKVEITASTFDVEFRKFATWRGETDANGNVKFELQLPDYFVGQPLQKGDAIVKLDVKVVDTAGQVVKVAKSYPVSDQPINVSIIPEGGRIVPDMENRIFVAAVYPDGTPAQCDVLLFKGKKVGEKEKLVGRVKTNSAGLAEFKFTPKSGELRTSGFEQQKIELLGGERIIWGPKIIYDVAAIAKDARGATAQAALTLNADPVGENVLLRLDKAVYRPGDRMHVDVRSSAKLPTVYVDIVRSGQVLLSRWLEVKDGQAELDLDLPPTLFGSLEVHAYQMLRTGEIIRDSRVIYVEPANDLRISVLPSKEVFAPGENGRIRFKVTDREGKPAPAALGVIIVDEAVYALQDMQPGLEKVYFTLQKELLKPQVQAKVKLPADLPVLLRQPNLPPPRQQIAQVLLNAVKPPAPKRWNVAPEEQRKQIAAQRVQQIGSALWNHVWQHGTAGVLVTDRRTGKVEFAPRFFEKLIEKRMLDRDAMKDPFGRPMTLEALQAIAPEFSAEKLAKSITLSRIANVSSWVGYYVQRHRQQFYRNGKWQLPDNVIEVAVRAVNRNFARQHWTEDVWGRKLRLVRSKKKLEPRFGYDVLRYYYVSSDGPDGKPGTKDDLNFVTSADYANYGGAWWMNSRDLERLAMPGQGGLEWQLLRARRAQNGLFGRGFGGGAPGGFGGLPEADMALPRAAMPNAGAAPPVFEGAKKAGEAKGGGKAAPRIREYFPETMLWQPQLITNDQGIADLSVAFADSITTWRLTASANSKGGALGGVTVPLKVFQDFFVDIDLPVEWTQGDEVAFPVAVYNYLSQPQTVKIELKKAEWFELLEGTHTRSLDLKPNEVTAVRFRIRANKIGRHPLTVMAYGSKKSDAVRRSIDVVPNGERKEVVINDQLKGNVTQTINIPQEAIPDSYKLLVRIYPGVMAQVLEGIEGMLRLPGG